MSKAHTELYYHLVWSTKYREPFIRPEIQGPLYTFIGHKCKQCGYGLHGVNGTEDHIHIVLDFGPTISVAQAVANLKGSSSRFCNRVFAGNPTLRWQTGYAALTISSRDLSRVVNYVKNQKARHRVDRPNLTLEAVDEPESTQRRRWEREPRNGSTPSRKVSEETDRGRA